MEDNNNGGTYYDLDSLVDAAEPDGIHHDAPKPAKPRGLGKRHLTIFLCQLAIFASYLVRVNLLIAITGKHGISRQRGLTHSDEGQAWGRIHTIPNVTILRLQHLSCKFV